jgi:recombinational DNA repair protein (RecF pathway)
MDDDGRTADEHVDQHEERRTRLYRVRGIVLRRLDLGEADRIITVFTSERGKLRIVAKGSGVRRARWRATLNRSVQRGFS